MKKILFAGMILFLLVFEVFGQNWQLDPAFGNVTLDQHFQPDPHVIEILAGGPINLTRSQVSGLPRDATGFISDAPDVDFYFETSSTTPLTIRVRGFGVDTVLLINDPAGRWHFNDDSTDFAQGGSLDPSITFRKPISGLYNIWVGTFLSTELLEVDLEITEIH